MLQQGVYILTFMDILQFIFSLLTLTLLEIVLGIDNLVFIAIVTQRVIQQKQKLARRLGLILALAGRLALLGMITWVIKLNTPLFSIFSQVVSGRDIFMLLGGGFLLVKGTWEIHHEVEPDLDIKAANKYISFLSCLIQIFIFDLGFSLDSILTAVGLTKQIWIMAIAIVIAIIMMLIANEPLAHFIEKNPTIKMLALSFLLLIGMTLVADGLGYEIPKSYIYFSILFSLFVQGLNMYRSHKLKKTIRVKN